MASVSDNEEQLELSKAAEGSVIGCDHFENCSALSIKVEDVLYSFWPINSISKYADYRYVLKCAPKDKHNYI